MLHDLYKLLEYKQSTRLQTVIYSYIFLFCRYLNIDAEIPTDFVLNTDLSVRDSNEEIVRRLRITPLQVEKLGLETLRPDAQNRRIQRYRQVHLGTSTKEHYQQTLKMKRQEVYQAYLTQKASGITTTQIAKNLNISRERLYQIINTEKPEANH